MDGYLYYITLGVIAIIAIQFFRGGHLMLSAATLAVGAWIIYSHDKDIDISDEIYKSIDEGAKSEYEERQLENKVFRSTEEDLK